MKLIFAGTPEFATPALQSLIDSSQHEIVAVYTQPDKPAGRGQRMRASPVKQLAEANGISVVQPRSLRNESAINELKRFQPDIMIVVAYGLVLPAAVLAIPVHGCLNVHASLLPRWRGAAPIQRAMLAGDEETGVTIMQMDQGLDTGGMLKLFRVRITDDMTAGALHDELAVLGASALLGVINKIDRGDHLQAVRQDDEQASYAAKLSKLEARINWVLPASQVLRSIKAFNPWPVAFTSWSGKVLRIWDARIAEENVTGDPGKLISVSNKRLLVVCGDGALVLLEVQPEGKKRMPARAYMNARKSDIKTGMIFD